MSALIGFLIISQGILAQKKHKIFQILVFFSVPDLLHNFRKITVLQGIADIVLWNTTSHVNSPFLNFSVDAD